LHDPQEALTVEYFVCTGGAPNLLRQGQDRTSVSIRQPKQKFPCLLVDGQRPAFLSFGALKQLGKAFFAMRPEDQHACAREKRCIQLKRGILGCRAHQYNRSIFHDWQEAVLLTSVEAMNLVHKKQRLATICTAKAGRLEHLFQVGDA
jgi:hypothetical protein